VTCARGPRARRTSPEGAFSPRARWTSPEGAFRWAAGATRVVIALVCVFLGLWISSRFAFLRV
jgi:hypothetical protein